MPSKRKKDPESGAALKVRLSVADRTRLNALAQKNGISAAAMIRRMIHEQEDRADAVTRAEVERIVLDTLARARMTAPVNGVPAPPPGLVGPPPAAAPPQPLPPPLSAPTTPGSPAPRTPAQSAPAPTQAPGPAKTKPRPGKPAAKRARR